MYPKIINHVRGVSHERSSKNPEDAQNPNDIGVHEGIESDRDYIMLVQHNGGTAALIAFQASGYVHPAMDVGAGAVS